MKYSSRIVGMHFFAYHMPIIKYLFISISYFIYKLLIVKLLSIFVQKSRIPVNAMKITMKVEPL